jgi:hypothetical protein
MNKFQKIQTFEKCCNMIVQCKTKDQLQVAENFCNLFILKIKRKKITLILKTLLQNHSINCI